MCEQTEINYLDGDIVWVKLGSCWWPGQVTGFHNLPEDIQDEFKKKPLIAAVKFFQEDTYEFVKNYQQIYKYNCTLKDEFIKKGLDKYRSKSKDGSRYMDKFPGDVEMAEKLTGGDPEILSQDKFSPEEKPNIAALFGDKKVAKKRRERDDTYRRNSAIEIVRKITHPRFLKESDHEVRIRQQPSSLPSTPSSTGSPQYPCHLCSFTSSRINVIICHIKSHRSGNSPMARSKVKTYSQHGGRISDTDTPKRKYVKKEKSQPSKTKSSSESGKRKQPKQAEKASKKKKTDPKIRDTILADWDDESDEDISLNQSKSLDISSIASSPSKSQLDLDKSEESTEKNSTITDSNEIIEEAEKLLRETEKLTSINLIDDSLTSTIHSSKNSKESTFDDKPELEKDTSASDSVIKESKSHKEEKESSNSDSETKQTMPDRDDKKSLLSCFDFHEEEPSIPPVRKKARVFHQKKEIIKEFELSQALKTEQEKEADSDKSAEAEDLDVNLKVSEKSEAQLTENVQDSKKTEETDEIIKEDKQNNEINGKGSSEAANDKKATPGEGLKKSATNAIEGELEIVEIFKVDKEVGENGKTSTEKDIDKEMQNNETTHSASKDDKISAEKNELKIEDKSIDDKVQSKDAACETLIVGQTPTKDIEDTLSERFTTETEDETVSESAETLPEQSENSDVADIVDPDQVPNVDVMAMLNNEKLSLTSKTDKKRRSRPRKNVEFSRVSTSESDSPTVTGKKNNSKSLEKQETDRKTSESDSERSYTGRKRKPNKKYLESEIYVQSVEQKTFKTDESQSEPDDKTSEMIKNKSRKNRKSMELDKKKAESTEYNEEKELKPSKTLDAAENKTITSKVEVKDKPIDTDIPKTIAELDIKLPIKEPPPEASEKSQDSKDDLELKDSGIIHGIVSEDTKSSIMESTIINSNKTTSESEKIENKEMVIDDEFNESKQNEKDLKDVSVEASNTLQLELTAKKEDISQEMDISKTDTEMLPPKKSQIKKFELTQMDFFDTEASTNQISIEPEPEVRQKPEQTMDVATAKTDLTEEEKMEKENVLPDAAADKKLEQIAKDIIAEKKEAEEVRSEGQKEIHETETKAEIKTEKQDQNLKVEDSEQFVKDTTDVLHDQQLLKRTSIQTRYKGKFTPDTGAKSKKDKELLSEEKSTNTFQEAFLKTLHMDKKKSAAEDPELIVSKGKKGKKALKRKGDEPSNVNVTLGSVEDAKAESLSDKLEMLVSENISNVPAQENNSQISVMTNFEGIEVVVDPNLRIDTKADDSGFQNVDNLASSSADFNIISKTLTQSPTIEDNSKSISSDMQKLDESSRMSASTPSPSSDVLVPVKKREMPRIIEAVTLSEPMQILKSKLLDKIPQKGGKHKLEMDSTKKIDQKSSPKAKVMKIESMSANSKMKTGSKVTSPHLSLTKKLQVLKAEEAETAAAMDAQKEQLNVRTPKSSTSRSANEKYIQQSSQSLADMELDINSMPFVLSEDVLTPESIEQMPVVISSIIPASSTIPSTLSFTPTTQIVSPTQTQFKLTNESTGEISPTKKKSGTPAILKNKNKGKPTITSIKTLVPPLTGGVKGLKFQSTATGKTPPLLTQKGSPGKYVVVQTSGGQQLRYSVQGKSGTQQKIAIPTGKSAGNAQVVQQGGKVVILTSAQSGQSKMLPLNITKTLGGKVPRIITSKAQVYCPISPQSIISPKTIIAPKGDVSPTTSKLASGHNIINTQGIITSKGVLTPIPGTIAKTALLGTLSQGIITKDGIYTPISASALSGKIIGSKALVTKGATILSSQSLGTSKAILTPILSTQGIVSTKGTILTPITGQQVKAIAAKSPSKSSKVQYQSVQQKVQLPMLQKSQKVPLSSSSHGRSGQLKSAGSTVVLQNTSTSHKNVQHGKKVLKQTIVQQGGSMQNITAQGSAHQTVGMIPQIHQKGKSASTSTVQKVIMPHGGRQSKSAQQKIVVQKMHEPGMTKQSLTASSTTIPTVSKMVTQQKQVVSTVTKSTSKAQAANKTSQQQKNLLNIAMNSVTTTNVNATLSTPLSLPPLEPIEPEKKSKIDNLLMETVQKEQPKVEKFNIDKGNDVEKVEEPKITAQPQIMALPTESSDGTQTYVLVTIDEQGQIQPLDNNTLMSLEGTTQNPDGTRTLYIDPSSLGEAGTLDNIVLQFDNGVLPNIQTSTTDSTQAIISESFPTSEVIQTSNQDILAAALANTDFQQEINLPENPGGSVMTTGLTQTSLINQTILQSTIIPPTEPISSPSVLETSLTLNQPIMTPLEVPSSLPIQSDTTPTSAVATIPSSLELPITITNPNISFIATGETQIQIPGNSMPDIGEIMDNPSAVGIAQAEIPASTQYLVLPNLEDNITVDTRNVQSGAISIPSVSYSSVSLSSNMGLQSPQGQTTPSMPIIDDTYSDNVQFSTSMEPSMAAEQTFVNVPVSEMLVSKASISTTDAQSQDVTVTSEMAISHNVPTSSQEPIVSTNEPSILNEDQDETMPLQEAYTSREVPVSSEELTLQHNICKDDATSNIAVAAQEKKDSNNDSIIHMQNTEETDKSMTSNMPVIDETSLVTSESNIKISPVEHMNYEVSDSNGMDTDNSQESKKDDKFKQLTFTEEASDKIHSPVVEKQAATSNEVEAVQETSQILPDESLNRSNKESMNVDETIDSKAYVASTIKQSEDCQRDEPSSQGESDLVQRNLELHFEETNAETSHETPSQSYDQFGISMTDSADLPSQSATKSENSREPSQSIAYEPMETDEEAIVTEPPTQSFEHSKINEASQSYETSAEASTSAPTQSFNELMQSQEERPTIDEAIDDQTFPTQSYEVGKAENISENLETDAEISQEGNIPSQSNDIGTDGIGTSSVSTNNSGLNEDETASSSYVPETPENQERDQDQESAISTSSYEIPPCEELNIASSSVIPDTSVRAEHTSIHDNGVPEIPTSSYNLNPDITSTHIDSVPTSSYEDQVIVEQNVSTSYEVPISMPGLEETCSQNFVTESTDHRNEPSSYYAHHQEVTASYYESVDQETNSRLEGDPQEEVTPSYYEGNPQEASQSYFNPEEATPSYSSHNVSPSYYDPRPESEASQSYYSTEDMEKTEQSSSRNIEASQSYYSTEDMEKTEQSSSQNIEASQSFYQEQSDELKLRQQGEATPTYTERYPVDYTLDSSPIERHDLVESSVPATRPTERLSGLHGR